MWELVSAISTSLMLSLVRSTSAVVSASVMGLRDYHIRASDVRMRLALAADRKCLAGIHKSLDRQR
jgi:hypothetical protein